MQLGHMIFSLSNLIFLFSPSNWHNLLWWYVACGTISWSCSVNDICVTLHFTLAFNFTLVSWDFTLPCLAICTLCPNLMKMSKSKSGQLCASSHLWSHQNPFWHPHQQLGALLMVQPPFGWGWYPVVAWAISKGWEWILLPSYPFLPLNMSPVQAQDWLVCCKNGNQHLAGFSNSVQYASTPAWRAHSSVSDGYCSDQRSSTWGVCLQNISWWWACAGCLVIKIKFKRSRMEALLLSRMVRVVSCHGIIVYWNVLPKIYTLLKYIIAYYRIPCLPHQLQLWELNYLHSAIYIYSCIGDFECCWCTKYCGMAEPQCHKPNKHIPPQQVIPVTGGKQKK